MEKRRDVLRRDFGAFAGSILQRLIWFYTLIYIYIGYFNGIFTRYYYEDYITLPFNPGVWQTVCGTACIFIYSVS